VIRNSTNFVKACLSLSLLLVGSASAMAETPSLQQASLNALGESLDIHYEVLSNVDDSLCRVHIPKGNCFSSELTIVTMATPIEASTSLYFSHIAPIRGYDSKNAIRIEHINGDLHHLTFEEKVSASEQVKITLSAPFWHASRSDAMPNYYLTYPALSAVVVASTTRVKEPGSNLLINQHTGLWSKQAQYKRTENDNTPLMDSAYLYNKGDSALISDDAQNRVIPNVVQRDDSGKFVAAAGINIDKSDQDMLAPAIEQMAYFGLTNQKTGLPLKVMIRSANDANALANEAATINSKEGYALSITEQSATIIANDNIGANYGLLTLMQIFDAQQGRFPITEIADSPRFEFRGMHLDIARHFPGKAAIESVVRQMFTYKLNKLHLHLSDDEGWRLAIDALPELTKIGAFRCHDLSETQCLLPQLGSGPFKSATGNGFLTQQDYIEILTMAHARGIEVIPSLDMPGHARAAIVAMNARYKRLMAEGDLDAANEFLLVDKEDKTQYESVQFYSDNTINPCLDSSYHFIETVLTAVKSLHEKANVPLTHFHVGADETAGAWVKSPVCAAKGQKADEILPAFVTEVQKIAQKHNIAIGGWSDGMEKAVNTLDNSSAYTNVWHLLAAGGEKTVSHFAKENIPVVLSFPDVLYFDFPYQSNPYEPGYYWGSRATDTEKVFSFMPEQLPLHADVWTDRMGHSYSSSAEADTSSVIGIQGQLWSEVTVNQDAVEYMVFPRLLALAERAWHYAPWQQNAKAIHKKGGLVNLQASDWQAFELALFNRHAPALVQQGVNVRVPTPAAVINNGKLHIKPVSGLTMEYLTSDNKWETFTAPVEVKGNATVRARIAGTQQMSRQVQL